VKRKEEDAHLKNERTLINSEALRLTKVSKAGAVAPELKFDDLCCSLEPDSPFRIEVPNPSWGKLLEDDVGEKGPDLELEF